jgi:hypothetical protein
VWSVTLPKKSLPCIDVRPVDAQERCNYADIFCHASVVGLPFNMDVKVGLMR